MIRGLFVFLILLFPISACNEESKDSSSEQGAIQCFDRPKAAHRHNHCWRDQDFDACERCGRDHHHHHHHHDIDVAEDGDDDDEGYEEEYEDDDGDNGDEDEPGLAKKSGVAATLRFDSSPDLNNFRLFAVIDEVNARTGLITQFSFTDLSRSIVSPREFNKISSEPVMAINESASDFRIQTFLDWGSPDPRHEYLLRFIFDADGTGDISSGDFVGASRRIESERGLKHFDFTLTMIRDQLLPTLSGVVSSETPIDFGGVAVPATLTLSKVVGEGRSMVSEAVVEIDVDSVPFEFSFDGITLDRFGEYYLTVSVDVDNSGSESARDLISPSPMYLSFAEDKANIILKVEPKQ